MNTAKKINSVDEYVEELKKGIGKVYVNEWGRHMVGPKWPKPVVAFNTQATRDSIKHFVDATGDLNPIFRDREYARKTKYGYLIAPPTFLHSIVYGYYPDPPGFPPLREFGLPLYAGDEYEWFSPLCEGDEFNWKTTFPTEIQVKPTRSGGTTAFLYGKHEFSRHQNNKQVATENFCIVIVEWPTGERIKQIKPEHTEQYIKKVYEAQDQELIRGANQRYWEDVKIGEELTPVVRGPITIMDKVSWVMGGIGESYFCSSRLFRFINEQTGWGTFDPDLKIYRNFHEDMFDKHMGPIGSLRTAWIDMALHNWMGDDGFLWKLKTSHRGLGMYGYVYWCKAKVIKKYLDAIRHCVDIDCPIEDHTGALITDGKATVILPSREHGPIVYPTPQKTQ